MWYVPSRSGISSSTRPQEEVGQSHLSRSCAKDKTDLTRVDREVRSRPLRLWCLVWSAGGGVTCTPAWAFKQRVIQGERERVRAGQTQATEQRMTPLLIEARRSGAERISGGLDRYA